MWKPTIKITWGEVLSPPFRSKCVLKGDVAQNDSQRRFLAQRSVTMLEQCCNYSKQFCNNVATLCCAKNGNCESSPYANIAARFTVILWTFLIREFFISLWIMIKRKKKGKGILKTANYHENNLFGWVIPYGIMAIEAGPTGRCSTA